MMRVALPGLCAVAALLAAGCGGSHQSSYTYTPDPPPSSEVATGPDRGCSDNHPRRLATQFDGFLVMCDDGVDGSSVTIKNISRAAIVEARPTQQRWTSASVGAKAQAGYVQGQIQAQVKATCGLVSCVVPPDTTLRVDADGEPVRGQLTVDYGASVAAAVATTALDAFNARLGTPGQRLMNRAASCYKAATGVADGGSSTEEWARRLLGTSSCKTLYQAVVNDGKPAEANAERWLPRVRRVLGASFEDIATVAVRIVHP